MAEDFFRGVLLTLFFAGILMFVLSIIAFLAFDKIGKDLYFISFGIFISAIVHFILFIVLILTLGTIELLPFL